MLEAMITLPANEAVEVEFDGAAYFVEQFIVEYVIAENGQGADEYFVSNIGPADVRVIAVEDAARYDESLDDSVPLTLDEYKELSETLAEVVDEKFQEDSKLADRVYDQIEN